MQETIYTIIDASRCLNVNSVKRHDKTMNAYCTFGVSVMQKYKNALLDVPVQAVNHLVLAQGKIMLLETNQCCKNHWGPLLEVVPGHSPVFATVKI